MPLYDPNRRVDVAPEDQAAVVMAFLERCRKWALEEEIPKRTARVAEGMDPAEAAKLHGWVTYLRFTEHAMREVEDGTLDAWFRDSG